MKPLDKKVIDIARTIYVQKVATTYMEPACRAETTKSRKEQFHLVAARAFEAAVAFVETTELIEGSDEVDEAAVEKARAEIALNSMPKVVPPVNSFAVGKTQ